MSNIIEDVSVLSTIPEKTLEKLLSKVYYCISDTLVEDIANEKDITELDIGIGVLYIRHIGEQVSYKFIPSENLEKVVNTTIIKKQNLLENVLNDSLAKKFMDVYKDLC